jgi:hypothetical protein
VLRANDNNHPLRSVAILERFDLSASRYYAVKSGANCREFIDLSVILLIGSVMLSAAWVGYVGSDDHSYARGALGWLRQFPGPYVGDDHWTLRHPVVVPIAISLALFGLREISLGLPSALMFLLFLATNYFYLNRFFGRNVARLSAIMLVTTPLFAVQATFPQDVIVQVLAVSSSFWLFYSATRSGQGVWLMFAAGLAAGVGWLTLETTAGFLLFYSILFLIGFGVPRRYYSIMVLGLVLIVGAEIGYFTALTGDPLYRYRIDLHHDVVDRSGDAAVTRQSGRVFDLEGNLSVDVFLQPVIALLLNQEFGILFWLLVPASIWINKKKIAAEERRLILLLIALAVVWIAFISLNTALLWVVPRYYSVATWAAVIIVSYWLKSVFALRSRMAMLVSAGWLATNLFCVYVENKNPLFAERALVDYVVRHRVTVYTDPMTRTRAKLLLEFQGVSERVLSDPAPSGALVYVNKVNIDRCKRVQDRCRWSWQDYLPREHWKELARFDSRPKFIGLLLGSAGVNKLIPEEIFNRLAGRKGVAALFRV